MAARKLPVDGYLCIGLHNSHGKCIAPRLLNEDGTVDVAASISRHVSVAENLNQRITALSRGLKAGFYPTVICADGVLIVLADMALDPSDLPGWLDAALRGAKWEAPTERGGRIAHYGRGTPEPETYDASGRTRAPTR